MKSTRKFKSNKNDAQRKNKARDIERRKNRKNKTMRLEFELDRE